MSIHGIRVQIAGSASFNTDPQLLAKAHEFVSRLVPDVVEAGGGIVTTCGNEPIGPARFPRVFYWTVLEAIARLPSNAGGGWPVGRRARFFVSTSQHALRRIPECRRAIWTKCSSRSDFDLKTIPAAWKFGGALRAQQVTMGDVLVTLGGGAGTEHLAELYKDDGKPVVPIAGDIGSTTDQGHGGSSYLHQQALQDVSAFFELREGTGSAAARLTSLDVTSTPDGKALASSVIAILKDLRPRRAFYVRLLDQGDELFPSVENHFRDIVDPVVREMGFTPHEVGRHPPLAAFINVEIFESLHRSGAVVVDLTGVRPNCMMELGYALGRQRRTIISAMADTPLPFDQDKLPTYFWDTRASIPTGISAFRSWFQRHLELPSIVN